MEIRFPLAGPILCLLAALLASYWLGFSGFLFLVFSVGLYFVLATVAGLLMGTFWLRLSRSDSFERSLHLITPGPERRKHDNSWDR